MQYHIIPHRHSALLKKCVYDIYEINSPTQSYDYYAAPNGIIGLSVNLSGTSSSLIDRVWKTNANTLIFGMITKPYRIKTSVRFREIAIGFKPYFFQLMVKESMCNLSSGAMTNAYDLFNKDLLDRYTERLNNSHSNSDIISAIEDLLRKLINPDKIDQRLLTASELIYNNQITRVDSLSKILNVSTVSIRNMFNQNIGLTPKKMIQTIRIYNALKQYDSSKNNLTQFAYNSGYFDQAHFIRDFKIAMGLTPKQYFSNEALTFDFYNFGRWNSNTFEAHNTQK